MFVSVYMTVKNGLPHIEEAIDSVVKQTFSDWELIVVDDGSSDGTQNFILQKYGCDMRVRLIDTGGVGRAQALNIAIENASGCYVANLDADDIFHPQKLELQTSCLEKSPYSRFICAAAETFHGEPPKFKHLTDVSCSDVKKSLLLKNIIPHSSVLFDKALCRELGGYNENRSSQIDLDLWFRFFFSDGPILKISSPLVAKRIHEGQSYENKNRIQYIKKAYSLRRKFLKKAGSPKRYRIFAFLNFLFGFMPYRAREFLRKFLPY